jgi:urea transport system permease protein
VVLTRKGWTAFVIALLVVCALAPLLNLVVPETSVFHMSDYAVALLGKIMCYAIAALAMDLDLGLHRHSYRWAMACSLRWAAM